MNKNDIKNRVKTFAKRLLDSARDEYYPTPAARIDTIFGSAGEYYIRLRKVKEEWDQCQDPARLEFQDYLRDNYGIQMKMMDGKHIDIQYEILDEKKHTLFLLKFGS